VSNLDTPNKENKYLGCPCNCHNNALSGVSCEHCMIRQNQVKGASQIEHPLYDEELLHLYRVAWLNGVDGSKNEAEWLKRAKETLKSRDQHIALEAQTNATAWAVGVIDKIHFSSTGDDDDNDPIFKGIKSAIRGQYERVTGVDPAPNYPITATLKQSQKEE